MIWDALQASPYAHDVDHEDDVRSLFEDGYLTGLSLQRRNALVRAGRELAPALQTERACLTRPCGTARDECPLRRSCAAA
jgi:hypothetical protein